MEALAKQRPHSHTTNAHTRLLLRVHSALGLHHGSTSQGVYCKLYLGETPMLSGSQRGLFGARRHSNGSDGNGDDDDRETHRIFRTRTIPHETPECEAYWDENFDVLVMDPRKEILSVRVKSKHRLFPSVIGSCAIHLKQLKLGRMMDQWVPLVRGSRAAGRLRLQLVLTPLNDSEKNSHRTRGVIQADILTALAANQSADEAIDRLLSSATFKKKRGLAPSTVDDPVLASSPKRDTSPNAPTSANCA